MIVAAGLSAADERVHAAVKLLGERQSEEPDRERRLERRAPRLVEGELRARDIQEIGVGAIVGQSLGRGEILRRKHQEAELQSFAFGRRAAPHCRESRRAIDEVQHVRRGQPMIACTVAAQRERQAGGVVLVAVAASEEVVVDVQRPAARAAIRRVLREILRRGCRCRERRAPEPMPIECSSRVLRAPRSFASLTMTGPTRLPSRRRAPCRSRRRMC